MIIQGKHAQIKLYREQIRIVKTYEDPIYVENEMFALSFLAKSKIMNLNPTKETPTSISMDWIYDGKIPDMSTPEQIQELVIRLSNYLKHLHNNSYEIFGLYINHQDVFLDNLLISELSEHLYFIDWGLSQRKDTVYPDIASVAMGVLNDYPFFYKSFLEEYFGNLCDINYDLIYTNMELLFNEYKSVREINKFETKSLSVRLDKARGLISYITDYYLHK